MFKNIIGESPAIKRILETLKVISDLDVTVLLQGESGVGKELLARAIHQNSKRRDREFVVVNCAAIPETLLESELFGYEKGAFTGAVSEKKGKFEVAHKGTIFLDEISEIPYHLQSKLLRVLQEKEVERLGSSKTIKVDVRIIAATNRNLEEEVKKGRFREDLFYRLYVVPIKIPPLRERVEDIPLLVNHFLKLYGERYGRFLKLSPEALRILMEYSWPGNIRELENLVHRLVILCEEEVIQPKHIDLCTQIENKGETGLFGKISLTKRVEMIEVTWIKKALQMTQGNKVKAAKLLGITRKALLTRIKRYNLENYIRSLKGQ